MQHQQKIQTIFPLPCRKTAAGALQAYGTWLSSHEPEGGAQMAGQALTHPLQ